VNERLTLPTVCLVRHGETEWTITGQHTGRSDIPLTARGEDQARKLARRLRALRFAHVFTSPLQRARRTCELAGFRGEARIDPDLSEWDYGIYEGVRTADIHVERPTWTLFDDGCPGGETADTVGARADRVIANVRRCDGDVLLFAHRDIFRVLAARWLDMPARNGRYLYMATASVSLLGYDHNVREPVIRVWSENAANER